MKESLVEQSLSPKVATKSTVLIKRLAQEFLGQYKLGFIKTVFYMMINASMAGVLAYMIGPLFDDVLIKRDQELLLIIPGIVVLVAFTSALTTFLYSVTINKIGQSAIADIQTRLFKHLMRADIAFLHNIHTGKLVSSFVFDASLMREALSTGLTAGIKDSLTFIFLVGVMFYRDWSLSLLVLVAFPVVLVPISKLGKRMRKASTQQQDHTGKFAALLDECFAGVRHVKAYGMEEHETSRARAAIEERLNSFFKMIRIRSAASPMMEFVGAFAVAIVFWYGGWRVIEGHMSPGDVMSFITALMMAFRPLKALANINTSMQEGLAGADRILHMLDIEATIQDKADAKPLAFKQGQIVLHDVEFAYQDGQQALHQVTLTVPAGQTVALVGPSGAGKSTILNMVPRFYDVTGGFITVDGQDLRDVTLESLRSHIGLVSQEAVLFDDTIKANIAYGKPDATEEEILWAAKQAAAHDFILAQPLGYDTKVGEAGVKLSGGQRQRIAIARAMLKNAPILLLDEATSALDTESERQVQAALETLMAGRTTVVVAHRLSTIENADKICVLDKGRLVEEGSHQELLGKGGLYARLYQGQEDGSLPE